MAKNVKKETKRNKSTKTAVVLFGAVLITTSLLGGTLAKYISDIGEAKDDARVAKWHVPEEFAEFDLFSSAYKTGSYEASSHDGANNATSKKNSVQSGPTTEDGDVIAPGTKGKAVLAIETGKPAVVGPPSKPAITSKVDDESEVAYRYVFDLKEDKDDTDVPIPFYKNDTTKVAEGSSAITGWNVVENGANYDLWLPLKIKVTYYDASGTKQTYDGIAGANKTDSGKVQVNALRTALKAAASPIIYPGTAKTDIEAALDAQPVTIEWEWPFSEQGTDTAETLGDGTKIYTGDLWDTQLGLNATGHVDGKDGAATLVPKFVLKIKADKVQID